MDSFEAVDLDAVAGGGDGVQWALGPSDDLNANLVGLGPGAEIGEHVNGAVDVFVVGLAGEGVVEVDGQAVRLAAHHAVLVRAGARRRIEAGPHGLRYLTVHRRRGPLHIGRRGG